MSQQEAAALVSDGCNWLSQVWVKADYTYRDALIKGLNDVFQQAGLPITVGRGWQPYDPVVKVNGTAHTYASLVTWAQHQGDGGVGIAKTFLDWAEGQTTLAQLPAHLQALAVITHFAEVGRGYQSALKSLYDMMRTVSGAKDAGSARAVWADYRVHFAPALKYAEDSATDYMDTH